jgi:hypothetical protein
VTIVGSGGSSSSVAAATVAAAFLVDLCYFSGFSSTIRIAL